MTSLSARFGTRIESHSGIIGSMTTQIAVRLPEELVAFVDEQVANGSASSRADLITRALTRERRRIRTIADIGILTSSEPDEDETSLDGWRATRAFPASD